MTRRAELLAKRQRATDTLDRIDRTLDLIDDLTHALAAQHDGDHGEHRPQR